MGRVHLVVPDPHAHFKAGNERADLVGRLILDLRPDVIVNLGDQFDMPSLSSYDKGLRSFHGKTYKADVDSGLDFSERMFAPIKKAKKRTPYTVFLQGNHEQRIDRALELSPELVGTVSIEDLDIKKYYNEYVPYTGKQTPGTIEIDGVTYAHFMVSGVLGRPIGGEHSAFSLVSKQFTSCTVGHTHTLDLCVRTNPHGRRIMGLVAGCLVDYQSDWAGEQQRLWWPGVVICHNVEDGQYDPEFVSIDRLRRIYGVGDVETE